MYKVDSVPQLFADHPDIKVVMAPRSIPGGSVAGFHDPAGNLYVFDQIVRYSRPSTAGYLAHRHDSVRAPPDGDLCCGWSRCGSQLDPSRLQPWAAWRRAARRDADQPDERRRLMITQPSSTVDDTRPRLKP